MNNFDRLTIALLVLGIVYIASNINFVSPPPRQQLPTERRPMPTMPTPAPPPQPASPPMASRTLAPATPFDALVTIDIAEAHGASSGSAFSVDQGGVWLTARHVAAHCTEILIHSPRGWVRAERRYLHEQADLAVLTTKGGVAPLRLSSEPLVIGQDGFTFGFPAGEPGAVHGVLLGRARLELKGRLRGVAPITAWAERRRVPDNDRPLSGLSGGPMLDGAGRLLGVSVGASVRRGRVLVTAMESINEMIDTKAIAPERATAFGGVLIDADNFDAAGAALRDRAAVNKVFCRGPDAPATQGRSRLPGS